MNTEEIKAIIILLESTLSSQMRTADADQVTRGVVALLKSKLPQ